MSINEINIESFPRPVTIEGTRKILHQMENNICKIIKKDGKKGSGFFVKIPYNNSNIPVMMTNYHVLDEQYLKENKEIKLTLNDDTKKLTIKLDGKRKIYWNKDYDTSIIEIKPKEDKINDFMELDDNILEENSNTFYIKHSIYIIHYPNSEIAKVSYAIINNIENYEISHYCSTEKGSSGSPIINLINHKVIGIHKKCSLKFKINYGTYLKNPINEFIKIYIEKDQIVNKTKSNENKKRLEEKNKKEKKVYEKNVS